MGFDAVFFRVDANVSIGIGHAKRCLNIASEMLKTHKGKICFIAESLPVSFQKELESFGIDSIIKENELQSELEFIKYALTNKGQSAVIVDSFKPEFYQEKFQKELIQTGAKVAYIAFDNDCHYYVHLLHNQNPLSSTYIYKTEPYTHCLLGLQNLILGSGIRQAAANNILKKHTDSKPVSLMTFGGSDPKNLTLHLLKALELIKARFSKHIVVIGAMYPYEKDLMDFIPSSGMEIEIHKNAGRMHELMSRSDIAFVAGGTTTWELGAMGVPVIVLPFGTREEASAKFLHQSGWAQLIEQPSELSIQELARKIDLAMKNDLKNMADQLRKEINTDGVGNFVHTLLHL